MMTTLIGTDGSVEWLVVVLLLLAAGLAAALRAATRTGPARAERRTPER
jgi:hypothetical protein